MDLADTYIMFVRQNQDILREKVNEEMYTEKLFDVSTLANHAGFADVLWRKQLHFDGMSAKQTLFFYFFFFYAANIVDHFISLTADRSLNWLFSMLGNCHY